MALVAVTNIDHLDDDGVRTFVEAGSSVSTKDFDKELLEHFLEIGSIAKVEVGKAAQDDDAKDKEIAALKAEIDKLKAAQKDAGPTGGAKQQ